MTEARTGRPRPKRRLVFLLAALAAVLLSSIAPATASAAKKTPTPGDNGDVKIHAVGTSYVDDRNEPHVCQFYLDAFNFDTLQQVSWSISQQPPTGHALAKSASITLTSGAGHTAVISLTAGHYKLTWTFVGEHGKAKFKVFWSDCAANPSASPSASVSGSPSPRTTMSSGGSTPTGTMNPSGQISASNGSAVKPSLAQTGSTITPWLAAAAGLVFAGALLSRRTRGRHMR